MDVENSGVNCRKPPPWWVMQLAGLSCDAVYAAVDRAGLKPDADSGTVHVKPQERAFGCLTLADHVYIVKVHYKRGFHAGCAAH